jgi:hypothetical protein
MYSPAQLKMARTITLIVWVFAGASFFFPLYYTGAGGVGRTLFGLLIAIHLVEFPVFAKTKREDGGSLRSHFARHIAFGMLSRSEVMHRHNSN